jgi:hypothetical protein
MSTHPSLVLCSISAIPRSIIICTHTHHSKQDKTPSISCCPTQWTHFFVLFSNIFFVSIDICVDIDVPEFFLLLCLAIQQDALACWCCRPFWKTLRKKKKKKCESSREHTKNTWFAFTSQNLYIPPFLFFYSFPSIFFSFSHYILQFSFFFFLLLRKKK